MGLYEICLGKLSLEQQMLLLAAQQLAMIAAKRVNKVRREIANADLNRAREKKIHKT